MKALVFHGPVTQCWEVKPKPALLSATDAIIKLTKTTLCGSDLAVMNGENQKVPDGLTLGHEGIGVIEEIGSEITEFKVGDRVMVAHPPLCGKCDFCKRGLYSTCEEGGWTLGRLIDGTLAEYARIPDAAMSLEHTPQGVDEDTLMMLKDILPTGFEYSLPNGQIKSGNTVAIFGTGHIGLTALLLSQFHAPSEIIMVDTNRDRLEAAESFGATKLLHAIDGNALTEIVDLAGGNCVDVAIVANANVALRSIWRSYGQPTLPLKRVLLMPTRRPS